MIPVPRRTSVRVLIVLALLGVAIVMLYWRGPEWGLVANAFRRVEWSWIAVAILLNLLSVVARSLAWRTVVHEALPQNPPPFGRLFSAFSIGLLANAVLPARTGELARVAVLTRRYPRGRGYAGGDCAERLRGAVSRVDAGGRGDGAGAPGQAAAGRRREGG